MVNGAIIAGVSILAAAILFFGIEDFQQPEIENVQDESIIEQKGKISEMQDETIIEQKGKISELQDQSPQPEKFTPSSGCSGQARCFTGKVTKIVDGDTIHAAGQSIRLALASTPELNNPIGLEAKQFVQQICPVGSRVIVDEDDGQTQGSHTRIVALVYCNGVNLNNAVIEEGFGQISIDYCHKSEFAVNAWSGCSKNQQLTASETQFYQTEGDCDPNYVGACIPINSVDLDCKDVPKNIKVVGSDPHRLDRDGDGIGCEG